MRVLRALSIAPVVLAMSIAAPATAGQAPPLPADAPVMRAIRTDAPIALDGRLDEPVWQRAEPATGFKQVEPSYGEPARFQTTVRVAYDQTHLYVAFVADDPAAADGFRVQDLRRKFDYFENEHVGMSLDPLGDGHNAYAFQITPLGNIRDLHVLDGAVYNRQWQAVWSGRTQATATGWTAELAIPWAALRYTAGTSRMRVNFHRSARRENEYSGWVAWPRSQNAYRMDFAGWLEDLVTPPPATALWARPYGTASGLDLDGARSGSGDLGGELLWQPTANTVVEGTVNTDFAQADIDRQVVNLRRFSVFFPEQRQFFLDSATLFDVGTADDLVIRPFFSRRIGLSETGSAIPLGGGVRAVRSTASSAAGVMALHQRAAGGGEGSSFLVGRASRNLTPSRRVGGLVTARHDYGDAGATSVTGAADAFIRFTPRLSLEGMVSGTSGDGRSGLAGYAKIARETNQFVASLTSAVVSEDYAPASGFVSRTNVALQAPYISYDWRAGWLPRPVRNLKFVAYSYLYTALDSSALEESYSEAWVDVFSRRGALFYADVQHFSQRVGTTFEPVPGVQIAPGRYSYWRPNLYYGSNRSRRFWYAARLYTGGFYDRTLDQAELQGFVSPSPRVALGVRADLNRFRGAGAATVTSRLLAPELRLAWSPRLQLTTFYQYNDAARQGTLNARLSWEYRPLSFLYVVLNDARGVAGAPATFPERRQLLIKLVYFGHF